MSVSELKIEILYRTWNDHTKFVLATAKNLHIKIYLKI